VRTTVGRDQIVNLVLGNRYPFVVHFDFVAAAYFATLGRATIHQVAARTSAIISSELRVEVLMPYVVTGTMISYLRSYILHRSCILRRSAQAEHQRERPAECHDELAPPHSTPGSF
jgi:hypothetical protein